MPRKHGGGRGNRPARIRQQRQARPARTTVPIGEVPDIGPAPPGERSIVHLGKHSFVKTVHPVLDVTIDSIKCPSLRFTLELAANFRGVALSISDGRIAGAGAGDGDVGLQLKYGEVTLLDKETRKVPFPARIDFKAPGLLIARTPETKAQGSR
jgi:hypothetical protein